MRKQQHIERATAKESAELLAREGDRSDWNYVRAMPQAEADRLAEEKDGPLPKG